MKIKQYDNMFKSHFSFDSDDDNDCEYDWGFKKANNDIQEEVQTKPAKLGKPDVFRDVISKRVAYQSADPLKLKDGNIYQLLCFSTII